MATSQNQVDGYLGKGWYDEWVKMEKQAKDEQNRFDVSRWRLHISMMSPLYDRIQGDLDILDGIATDYRQGMTLIISGRRIAKDKVGTVHDLYTLALGVAESENDMLEALFVTGFAAAWVVFPFVLLEAQSQTLLHALDELNAELHEAEREARSAKTKMAIHGVVIFFELLVPELSLTARAAIYLGDVVMDKALGPKDPTTTQKYTGIVTPGVRQFSEAVHHIEEYGEKARSVAKKTGTLATAATFYFDWHEIDDASERVEKLEELIKKAKEAYDQLVEVIEKNKPMLTQFLFAYERWERAITAMQESAANIRKALKEDMARAGYDPTRAMVWPITP